MKTTGYTGVPDITLIQNTSEGNILNSIMLLHLWNQQPLFWDTAEPNLASFGTIYQEEEITSLLFHLRVLWRQRRGIPGHFINNSIRNSLCRLVTSYKQVTFIYSTFTIDALLFTLKVYRGTLEMFPRENDLLFSTVDECLLTAKLPSLWKSLT